MVTEELSYHDQVLSYVLALFDPYVTRMREKSMKPVQTYQATGITVTFDPNLCIHSAVCLKSLPAVFDTRRKPWIQVAAATVSQIASTIDKCPSRALKYVLEGREMSADEAKNGQAQTVTTIQLARDGPLLVSGAFVVIDENGVEMETTETAALCRCGATGNSPFCDGSHLTIRFVTKPKR
ncbi:MAG: hypothetical protein C4516_05730 [Oxalobacter sp.]|nr:MAG: hypothetical protein C4516_05730 [Oxalobacter sp.]